MVHNELDIVQPDEPEAFADPYGIVDDCLPDVFRNCLGRIDRDRVTGVNAGSFDMFHDARDIDIFTVGDRVDFQFPAKNVPVNQDRGIMADFLDRSCHIDPQFFFIMDNFHGPATQHITRSDQYRIADFTGNLRCPFHRDRRCTFRLRNLQFIQHRFELMPVFRRVDVFKAGAEDPDTMTDQAVCQVDSCLAAELDNDAERLFQIDDMHDIFCRQRLKIKLI